MNAIRSVFNALSTLAASIVGLAAVIDMATGRLRQQLEHEPPQPLPALSHRNVIDAADSPAPRRKAKVASAK